MTTWGWIAVFTVVAGFGMLPLVVDRATSAKLVGTAAACLVLAFFAALLVIALPKTIA
ncbi:hypothetical protein KV102_05255 [Mumia sp. zg.B53]|uniref:hypothetical protein n=1 Tax=unclassified Mumia TaxID=2621872 RepID=UPI001C6E8561|nr:MULTISPECIES: hypothetical protein [unclassified Mumia]MBW9214244.1 hypothetical protein [Mumia sp. zg.B53]MDD9348074.1 hypothetical protein [Mumia sp.]